MEFTHAIIALKRMFAHMTSGELLDITFTFNSQTSAENAKEGVSRMYRDFPAAKHEKIFTLLGVRLRFKFRMMTEGEI